jgi:hypothetical protein
VSATTANVATCRVVVATCRKASRRFGAILRALILERTRVAQDQAAGNKEELKSLPRNEIARLAKKAALAVKEEVPETEFGNAKTEFGQIANRPC